MPFRRLRIPSRRTPDSIRCTFHRIRPRGAADYGGMTTRRMPWRFIAAFWALFGAISGFQVWIGMITHGHSVPRLVGYFVAVWEAWLLATAAIVWLARRWPVVPLRRLPLLVHILAACAIGVLHSVYWVGLM